MHNIPELDEKGLREFGLVTGGMLVALFGLIFPWLLDASLPIWPWLVGGLLAAWGLIAPKQLRLVHHWWMRLALALSRVTTPLILGVVFFLVIAPVGLLMRALGRDAMARQFDQVAASYRVRSRKPTRDNMEKPF